MRILSGVQPSGKLHIGNYLGALKQWIELQNNHECFFMIVDLHAITVPQNPKILQENILGAAIDYLSLGLDPSKCRIFIQSRVKEHAELAWILGTITPLGDLERMTQFKEKSAKRKLIGAGLFNYPILMAADILLYKTETVPVGEDQLQHIELARSLAKRFNNTFGETFPLPKPTLPKFGARIMSLRSPLKKMSKSEPEGCLFIFDSPDETRKKIKTAVTDSGKEIIRDPEKKPAVSNLLEIYHLLSGAPFKEIEKKYEGKGYGEFKTDLAEIAVNSLEKFRQKNSELSLNPDYVLKILKEGENAARLVAEQTMKEVKEKIGLI